MGLADLHIHTVYSYDGTASVPAVLEQARKVGLDIIAITDHDVIRGALLAEQLAPKYGVQVLPGIEITTADGDLLGLGLHQMVPAGRPLIETLHRVGELGGFCVAPHPGASGMGMKSLGAYSIFNALRDEFASQVLIGIETYNATIIDRASNLLSLLWAEHLEMAQTGSSDAHILDAIGLGATVFPGKSIPELVTALKTGTTRIQKASEWSTLHVLAKWAANYLLSAPARISMARA